MRFAKDLRDAFERYGFITLENHGLEQDLIDQTYGEAERFFALPEASKLEASIPGVGGNFGYTPFGREHAKDETRADLKEFYHFAQRHTTAYRPEAPLVASGKELYAGRGTGRELPRPLPSPSTSTSSLLSTSKVQQQLRRAHPRRPTRRPMHREREPRGHQPITLLRAVRPMVSRSWIRRVIGFPPRPTPT